jgi:hypothetical protein
VSPAEQDFGSIPAPIHAHAQARPGQPALVADDARVAFGLRSPPGRLA